MSPAPTRIAAELGVAVMAAVPCLPSTVAVIVADPGAHAVTTPRAFTRTTLWSLDVQVVTRSPTGAPLASRATEDRKSTRLNSSHLVISYAVFCLKKKTERRHTNHNTA